MAANSSGPALRPRIPLKRQKFRIFVWNVENLTDKPRPNYRRVGDRTKYIAEIIFKYQVDLCLIMETGPDVEEVADRILHDHFMTVDPDQKKSTVSIFTSLSDHGYNKVCSGVTGKPSWPVYPSTYKGDKVLSYGAETYCAIYKGEQNDCIGELLPTLEWDKRRKRVTELAPGVKPIAPRWFERGIIDPEFKYYRAGWYVRYNGLHFCVGHYPSPSHPLDTRINVISKTREGAMKKLRETDGRRTSLFFCGDFNIQKDIIDLDRLNWRGPGENREPENTSLRRQKAILNPEEESGSQAYDRVYTSHFHEIPGEVQVASPRTIITTLGDYSHVKNLKPLKDSLWGILETPLNFGAGTRYGTIQEEDLEPVEKKLTDLKVKVEATQDADADFRKFIKNLEAKIAELSDALDSVGSRRQLNVAEDDIDNLEDAFDSYKILLSSVDTNETYWILFRTLLSDHLPIMIDITSPTEMDAR